MNTYVLRSVASYRNFIQGVFPLVVVLVEHKYSILDAVSLIVGRHHAGKHVPVAGLDARGERPVTTKDISPIRFSRATGWKDEGRRDQRISIPVPDGVLRLPGKHAQHPVMAGKIREIPRHGSVRLPQRVGAIDQSDIVKLGTSNPFGLHESEQTGVVQITL